MIVPLSNTFVRNFKRLKYEGLEEKKGKKSLGLQYECSQRKIKF